MTIKIQEKINQIEEELSRTQINKATMHHICLLKARLARHKREILETVQKKSGASGPGFEIKRSGDARIGLFGFPSVGKSSLLNALTGADSKVAAYEFTTLTPQPGILRIHGAKIQILDLPGIIEGAVDGAGRGRQVIAMSRTCTLILMVLDGLQSLDLLYILERELGGYGVRLNKEPPKILVDIRDRNGISVMFKVKSPDLDEDLVKEILTSQYRIFHAFIRFDEVATVDDLIDVLEGNRIYLPCIYVINKCDQLDPETIAEFSKRERTICVSAHTLYNLNPLVDMIWDYLDLVRIYTQKKGEPRDDEPLVLKSSKRTIKDFCNAIHTGIAERFKFAWVSGTSVKYQPARCGITHELNDGDVVTLILKG